MPFEDGPSRPLPLLRQLEDSSDCHFAEASPGEVCAPAQRGREKSGFEIWCMDFVCPTVMPVSLGNTATGHHPPGTGCGMAPGGSGVHRCGHLCVGRRD